MKLLDPRSWLTSVGPALIVAAVVVGPGSILASSKVGAELGYEGIWIPVFFGFLLFTMVLLSARIGLAYERTPCGEIAFRLGRPVAIAIGIVLFLIIACFQSSNNSAVIAGLEPLFESGEGENKTSAPNWLPLTALIVTNLFALVALYGVRRLYGLVETLMKLLVGLMVAAFLVNCFLTKPSLVEAAKGLVPPVPDGLPPMVVQALIATTFSVAAAFYQAYLVRERGWTLADTPRVQKDAAISIGALAFITIIIMMTSAAVFHGKTPPVTLKSAADVARQLEPLFGSWAKIVFSIGFFAGAFSSFLVNAIIGGVILADGLGKGSHMGDKSARHLTALALIIGMLVAVIATATGKNLVGVIVFAQALTVVGVPALALALIYLGTRKADRTGGCRVASPILLVFAWTGFAITLLLATRTVHGLWMKYLA